MEIAEAQEYGSALKLAIERICEKKVPFELNVDSRSLFDTTTKQHESKDFRLRQAVRSLCESYEAGALDCLQDKLSRCSQEARRFYCVIAQQEVLYRVLERRLSLRTCVHQCPA